MRSAARRGERVERLLGGAGGPGGGVQRLGLIPHRPGDVPLRVRYLLGGTFLLALRFTDGLVEVVVRVLDLAYRLDTGTGGLLLGVLDAPDRVLLGLLGAGELLLRGGDLVTALDALLVGLLDVLGEPPVAGADVIELVDRLLVGDLRFAPVRLRRERGDVDLVEPTASLLQGEQRFLLLQRPAGRVPVQVLQGPGGLLPGVVERLLRLRGGLVRAGDRELRRRQLPVGGGDLRRRLLLDVGQPAPGLRDLLGAAKRLLVAVALRGAEAALRVRHPVGGGLPGLRGGGRRPGGLLVRLAERLDGGADAGERGQQGSRALNGGARRPGKGAEQPDRGRGGRAHREQPGGDLGEGLAEGERPGGHRGQAGQTGDGGAEAFSGLEQPPPPPSPPAEP